MQIAVVLKIRFEHLLLTQKFFGNFKCNWNKMFCFICDTSFALKRCKFPSNDKDCWWNKKLLTLFFIVDQGKALQF